MLLAEWKYFGSGSKDSQFRLILLECRWHPSCALVEEQREGTLEKERQLKEITGKAKSVGDAREKMKRAGEGETCADHCRLLDRW